MKLKDVIERSDTGVGKAFDLTIQFLILISLVSFSIETLPNLGDITQQILRLVEVITVAIFSVEYILRIVVAENKLRFIFSFYGLIDLLAIFPFYITRSIDLRSVRVFRLLRLARAFKLLRFSQAARRFQIAFFTVRAELTLFFLTTLFLLYVTAVGIYYFENPAQPETFSSIFHSLWWAVSTLTTVGYGDLYPITVGGKVFTFFVLMIGLGLVAVPTGLMASAMTTTMDDENDSR